MPEAGGGGNWWGAALGRPSSSGRSGSGLLANAYLHSISRHDVPLAILSSLLMCGLVYQGYNAVHPSFYPELFRTRVRVTAMAIGQNTGTTITAIFAAAAPPGSGSIPLTVGSLAFAVTVVSAAAVWSTRETAKLELGGVRAVRG